MSKKYSYLAQSELLELTDADLEGVYGGRPHCQKYLYYPDYYNDASSEYDSTSSGFLDIPILSQDNLLNNLNIG